MPSWLNTEAIRAYVCSTGPVRRLVFISGTWSCYPLYGPDHEVTWAPSFERLLLAHAIGKRCTEVTYAHKDVLACHLALVQFVAPLLAMPVRPEYAKA